MSPTITVQPVNSMFLVTFSRITVWRIWDLILAVILIVVGVNMAGEVITAPHILTFILLALSGMIVIYSCPEKFFPCVTARNEAVSYTARGLLRRKTAASQ